MTPIVSSQHVAWIAGRGSLDLLLPPSTRSHRPPGPIPSPVGLGFRRLPSSSSQDPPPFVVFRWPPGPFSAGDTPPLMQAPAAAAEDDEKVCAKKPRHCEAEMPLADANNESSFFPVEEIVQDPLPGY
ncbi:hypothetical protein GW17_00029366, partial [Ensete ventricosum]